VTEDKSLVCTVCAGYPPVELPPPPASRHFPKRGYLSFDSLGNLDKIAGKIFEFSDELGMRTGVAHHPAAWYHEAPLRSCRIHQPYWPWVTCLGPVLWTKAIRWRASRDGIVFSLSIPL
jgi:hypothetical protein